MSDKIVRHYDESRNPQGAFFAGVPTRDITEDEWESLPEYVQQSVDASAFYLKSKPRNTSDEKPPAEKES